MGGVEASPGELVRRLTEWGGQTPWCDWIELGGSLGRGAGDEFSDVDAGAGISVPESEFGDYRDRVLASACQFAPVAGTLVQALGSASAPADHLIVQYLDGRQLSLVVMPAGGRDGLPPQAIALLNRTGRLSAAVPIDRYHVQDAVLREWSFLAWISLGDAAKHAHREHFWRAMHALTEARDQAWRLYAAAEGITFPAFGAVSAENAGLVGPTGLADTVPRALDADSLADAIRALVPILDRLTLGHDVRRVRDAIVARLDHFGGCSHTDIPVG